MVRCHRCGPDGSFRSSRCHVHRTRSFATSAALRVDDPFLSFLRLVAGPENVSKGEYIFGHLFGTIGIVLLLDRYFLSIPALQRLAEGNRTGHARLHLVTKAKMNAVAYESPNRRSRAAAARRRKGGICQLELDAQAINTGFGTLHDVIHELPNVSANVSNRVVEHAVDDVGFEPFPKPFDNVQFRAVRR